MKVLETVESYLDLLGFFQPKNPLHRIFILSFYPMSVAPMIWFIIHEANSVADYAQPLAEMAGLSVPAFCYWATLWNRGTIIELIDDLKKIVERRKLTRMNSNLTDTNFRLLTSRYCAITYGTYLRKIPKKS